ncbi:nucleomorphin [Calliphora vicina]|uniref:nucleomorphin n=1 Tax=Calliphora vicina TaxID=7373 RepID=UPI00325B34FF
MKSFTILLLIFLTLVIVDSDGNSNKINNTTTNSSSRFTKNTFSTNIHNFNTSIVGDSSSSATFRDKRGTDFALDQSEIARQNQITQQILSNYLERRLFPHRSANQKIPTIAEILPKPKTSTVRPRPRGFAASSPSYKKGAAAKQQQRKTYGNGHKNRNSLFQRHKQQPTAKPQFEDDYEEVETERNINNNSGRKRQNDSSREQNNDDDFADEAVVEDVEEEAAAEEEEEVEAEPEIQKHNYRKQLHRQQQLHRHHYRYLEDIDDPEPDGQESLQSVESEQHDHYYSSNGSSGDIFSRDPSENEIDSDCPNCVDDVQYMNKWTMPLLKLGEKRYYLGIFFKANWFKATQYCRYHGMHLASISSQEENDRLEKHIRDFGLGHEHFWTSGTDLADEGNFFWMSTGRPITFTNWNAGEPNNFRYENGEEENCLELWNRDGKGLKWNDSPCSFETYFVCEVQPN